MEEVRLDAIGVYTCQSIHVDNSQIAEWRQRSEAVFDSGDFAVEPRTENSIQNVLIGEEERTGCAGTAKKRVSGVDLLLEVGE